MNRRRLKNQLSHSAPFQITSLIVILVLVCLSAIGPSTAQRRTFTARPIGSGRTLSLAKKDIAKPTNQSSHPPVSSRKGAPKGSMKAQSVSAVPCDVTIAPGASPSGYLPLSGMGIDPVPGVGDDTITDFDTPPYTFAGETYSRIGFASNGYAVIGGITDPADNTTVNQSFPDATIPNNVLAPFWTDLNPDNGGALRIGIVTDNSDSWIVLDWAAVSEFSNVNANSFEIWIGINGDAHPGEDISFAYGPIQGSGNGGFLTVGAENKIGTHGQNSYFNGTGTLPAMGADLRVSTTSCVANRPWTATGSSGTIDEDSLSTASVTNFVLGLNPGSTGNVTARYNITPTRDLSRFCPATASHIAVRFRDEDASGVESRVLLTIHESNIASGTDATIFTFDSNVSAQSVGTAFQTFATNAPITFDFGTNVYWLEAQVSRSNASLFVNFGSIQISESDGTPCP